MKFFDAAAAVKIGASLKSSHEVKLRLPKSLIHMISSNIGHLLLSSLDLTFIQQLHLLATFEES